MNNVEAKFILQAYRPNGADAGDPAFAAALAQAQADPSLQGWLVREQAFDGAISAKLGTVPAPAGLREAILAGGRATTAGSARPARWWNQPLWLAAAASIAVIFAAGLALWPRQAGAFTDFALADTRLSGIHGGHGQENNELQAVLNNPATRLGQPLPINFSNLHETGCRTVKFRGHDVLELCFKRDGVWFHCYIGRAADFPQFARNSSPLLADHGGVSLASWADAENVIVVVSKTGRKSLEALL